MATFIKVNDWLVNMANAADMNSDTFRLALSNTTPASESPNPLTDGNGVLANVTQISYTNYSDDLTSDRTLEGVSSAQAAGVYTFDFDNVVITASGGTLPDFRYVYVYDDTVASPADPLVGVWDHGSAISLTDGSSATITVNASGAYTIT
jgi:hypothetical protein